MKTKRRLKKNVKIALFVILIGGFGLFINKICNRITLKDESISQEIVVFNENTTEKESENTEILVQNEENSTENAVEMVNNEPIIEKNEQSFRLTSFYPEESSDCTGSGKCSWDFQINDKGWYTWDGKIVLAAATTYLQKKFGYIEGKKYFKYYDEVDIIIDNNLYRGIILDSCGACMTVTYEERLDLFVNSSENIIDRGYKGNNPINVSW